MLNYESVVESITKSDKPFKLYWEVSYIGDRGKITTNRFDRYEDYLDWLRKFLDKFVGTMEFFLQRRYECGDEYKIMEMSIETITKYERGGCKNSRHQILDWPQGKFN